MPDVCTTCRHCYASSVMHPSGSQVQPQSDVLCLCEPSFNLMYPVHEGQSAGARPSAHRCVPQLKQLDLSHNPVQQHKAYSLALSALTGLSQLDGQTVQQEQQATSTCLTPALLHSKVMLWHSSTGACTVTCKH